MMADTSTLQGLPKAVMGAFKSEGMAPFAPRIYWERLPSVMQWTGETILFEQAGGVPLAFSEGALGDKRNARVQVNVWATDPLTRDKLVDRALEIAVRHGFTQLTEPDADFDSNVELYSACFDLSVWWDRNF